MPGNLYEVIWIFLIYGFIGWCTEVVYAALNEGVFVNRGFLNGPYCPIYGCGMLILAVVLTPLQENLLLLFLGSFLLTTILEYITGFVLEKVFGNKWWDYSDFPFNLHGYVCLKFSILWGLGGIFIMDIVHPFIYRLIRWFPEKIGIILIVIMLLVLLADICVTVNTVLKFNRELKAFEKMERAIRKLSDELGESIFDTVAVVMDKTEEIQEDLKEKHAELKALNQEYRHRLESKHFGFRRLTKAFPGMRSQKWNEGLQKYKEYLETKKQGRNKGE